MRLVIFIWKTILYLPRNFYFKNSALSKIVLPLLRQRQRVAKKNIELCFANENKNITSEILKNNFMEQHRAKRGSIRTGARALNTSRSKASSGATGVREKNAHSQIHAQGMFSAEK